MSTRTRIHPVSAFRRAATRRPDSLLVLTAVVQGVFYIATGVWSIVSIETFEAVTGPKLDEWLVKTAGVLVIVSGCVFLLAAARRHFPLEVVVLAIGNALALTAIDVIYVSLDRIPAVYLLDAVAEVVLACGWLVGLWLRWRT